MPGQDAVEDFLQLVGFQEVFELEEGDANLLTIMGYLFIVTQQGCTVLLQKIELFHFPSEKNSTECIF